MHKMTATIFLSLLLILVGCIQTNPSNLQSPEAIEARLVGLTKDEVVAILGAPEAALPVTATAESWTYTSFASGLTGGECKLTLTLVNGKVTVVNVNAADRSWVSAPMGSCRNLLTKL